MATSTKNSPSKRAPAKKAPAKKASSRAATKKVSSKRPPAKRTTKQPQTRKRAGRKATGRKATTRETPAKRATSRRSLEKGAAGSARKPIGHRTAKVSALRVVLEGGPKGKKSAAVAPDWPGLERGAKTEEAATAALQDHLPRYAEVAKQAKMDKEFAALTTVDVVERYPGTGSTDFWGISFAFSSFDWQAMSSEQLERELTLMQACWTVFDRVRGRVSAQMQKGPRGGGRDRDRIVRHTLGVEQDWARKVGVHTPRDAVVTDPAGLKAYRGDYCAAIRSFHAEGKIARTWPLRYLIRHTAYHTMDHAWEMEDKDLSRENA